MREPDEPTPGDGRSQDGDARSQDGDAAPDPAGRSAGRRPDAGPGSRGHDRAPTERDAMERDAAVDEPSDAQGTGDTGQPVSDEPDVAMPKPTEEPGRARRRAEPEPPGDADSEGTGAPAPQAPVGWLPRGAEEIFGAGATAELAYELLTVDVSAERWIAALETARDELGCTYFDWLSAVDEPGIGFCVCAHVVALPEERGAGVRRMVVRTTVPHEAPALPTATLVYAGAAWHERETHEMFGVDFTGHPHLAPLLLPEGFEGHPLRKDFVLAARVAKAWPGAKEPGESGHGGPKRRQMLPPGVPDPNEWGPLKGQLPPAPSRPARGRAAAGGDRPARRTRSASAGSASQRPSDTDSTTESPRPPRRARSAGEGSASRRTAPAPEEETSEGLSPETSQTPRRARSAGEGSASQREAGTDGASVPEGDDSPSRDSASPSGKTRWAPRRARSAGEGSASQREPRPGEVPVPEDTASTGGTSAADSVEAAGAGERPGTPHPPHRSRSASEGSAGRREAEPGAGESAGATSRSAPRSADAPWHHARPAFTEGSPDDSPTAEGEARGGEERGDDETGGDP